MNNNPAEVGKQMIELSSRRAAAAEDIVKVARGILPILRDHKLEHTANELAEKFFILDAVDQECRTFAEELVRSSRK